MTLAVRVDLYLQRAYMPTMRTETFNMRITPDEARMLKELAEADGLSASDVVRLQVRRYYAERFGAKPGTVKKRKR